MARKLFFKGVEVEKLESMSINEFINLIPSRHRRSLKKGFSDVQKRLLKVVKEAKEGKFKKKIKTHCRNMVIVPEMLGLIIYVHNGKEFIPVNITYEMLGRYLGEFALTRGKVQHSAPGIGATKSSAAASVK